jgi:hypothetical protein
MVEANATSTDKMEEENSDPKDKMDEEWRGGVASFEIEVDLCCPATDLDLEHHIFNCVTTDEGW